MKTNANRIAWAAVAIILCAAAAAGKHRPKEVSYQVATFAFYEKGTEKDTGEWVDTIHCAENVSLENCRVWAGGIDPVIDYHAGQGFVVDSESGRMLLQVSPSKGSRGGPVGRLHTADKFYYHVIHHKNRFDYWYVPCDSADFDVCRKGEFEYVAVPVEFVPYSK
jgi:hypothetical protein